MPCLLTPPLYYPSSYPPSIPHHTALPLTIITMLRLSSSFFLLVLALLACTATAFFHVAAPVAPRHVLFATKAETVRQGL